MVCGMSAEQQQLAAAEKAWLTRHDPIARLRTQLDEAVQTIDHDGRRLDRFVVSENTATMSMRR